MRVIVRVYYYVLGGNDNLLTSHVDVTLQSEYIILHVLTHAIGFFISRAGNFSE